MAVTSVRFKPELESLLETLAKQSSRSKNWLINQAVRDYVMKNQQETMRWEETLIALESVKNGQGIPEEKVDTWLQSWGTDCEIKPPKE